MDTGAIRRSVRIADGYRSRVMANDPPSKDEAAAARPWIRRQAASLGGHVARAFVTTVALSVGFMIFNDYVAPPPDFSGNWKFTVVYKDTSLDKFRDLQVTYRVLLIQEGMSLSGHGEKLSDRSPTQDAVDYTGDRRTHIRIGGSVTRNFFSSDALLIHYSEKGRRRDSATIHRLAQCGAAALCGCFQSTIADTTGPVWWQRLGGRDRMYEPVAQPDDCPGGNCRAAPRCR